MAKGAVSACTLARLAVRARWNHSIRRLAGKAVWRFLDLAAYKRSVSEKHLMQVRKLGLDQYEFDFETMPVRMPGHSASQ